MYLKSWSHIEIHLFGLVKPYFFRSNQFILSALSSQAHQIRTSPGADFFPLNLLICEAFWLTAVWNVR